MLSFQKPLWKSLGVQGASPGTLQLTGVLGLAALLYGLYALRGPPKPDRDEQRAEQIPRAPGSSAAAAPSSDKAHRSDARTSATASSTQVRESRHRDYQVICFAGTCFLSVPIACLYYRLQALKVHCD